MNFTGGAKKKKTISRKIKKVSRSSRNALKLPKTAKVPSRKSRSFEKFRASNASSSMSITDLQFLAKSRGIPFGGLTKTKLVRKINNYY